MGLIDKFFGKKQAKANTYHLTETEIVQLKKGDSFISTGDNNGFKIIKPLNEAQKLSIHKSTILLRTGKLYMHYWTDNLISTDRNDPEWQNKVLFFWKAEEPFPKKSLPPEFDTFTRRFFLFTADSSKLTLQVGQAMPWFGMPGLGEKHVCEINGEKVDVPELSKLGLVEYIEPVELTTDNLDILANREEYFFLIDERIVHFSNGNFYLNDKSIPIDLAYSIGGINIIKKMNLA